MFPVTTYRAFRLNLTDHSKRCSLYVGHQRPLFSACKHFLRVMCDGDCVSCIMFDEMFFRENLHFNQKFGCIEGLEDLGNHGRASNVAYHSLVIMLRVLCKKWKQPILYYLINKSSKGEMPVNFFMEVFDACHSAALQVVATM